MRADTIKYSVILESDRLSFSAMHLITFPIENSQKEGENRKTILVAEPLHGHDFRATMTITGPLNEHRMVVDFIAATNLLWQILLPLHSKVIFPQRHPFFQYQIGKTGENTLTTLALPNQPVRKWSFPAEDIFWLGDTNATTESIAGYILESFRNNLATSNLFSFPAEEYHFQLKLTESIGCAVLVED